MKNTNKWREMLRDILPQGNWWDYVGKSFAGFQIETLFDGVALFAPDGTVIGFVEPQKTSL